MSGSISLQPIISLRGLSLQILSLPVADLEIWWHCVCLVWTSVSPSLSYCNATWRSWRGWNCLTVKISLTHPLPFWQPRGQTPATTWLNSHWRVRATYFSFQCWLGLLYRDSFNPSSGSVRRVQRADRLLPFIHEAPVFFDSVRPAWMQECQQTGVRRLHCRFVPHHPLLHDGREADPATRLKGGTLLRLYIYKLYPCCILFFKVGIAAHLEGFALN